MALIDGSKMDFSNKHFVMAISGMPNTGKSTLAFSAPKPVNIDVDEGVCRVKAEHRRATALCKNYEEIQQDIESVRGKCETVIIDTAGALIEMMKEWAMRTDPAATKKNGGFSLQGFGIIKSEFSRWLTNLKKDFNVIFVFHENMVRKDDTVFYDLVCEGSAKTLIYQACDLAMHMFMLGGKRMGGFTPTEEYYAKSAYGIKGLIEIPELKDGDKNDFITRLFETARTNLKAEVTHLSAEQEAYDEFMKNELASLATITNCADINSYYKYINSKEAPHVLTSKKEIMNAIKNRCNELGIVWDSEKKAFVEKDEN